MSAKREAARPGKVVKSIQKSYDRLERKLLEHRDVDDPALLRRAFAFAAERHAGQKRKTGEPYLAHPLHVAHILADLRLDEVTLVGALLHDTVEDTPVTVQQLTKEFGPDVGRCVDGVTKIGRLRYSSSETRQAETFRKMLMAMVRDVRVILIKLADRLHNMRTLHGLDDERRKRIALETREIYAPIALRLGMGKVRSELEDLAFSYLEPQAFRKIARQIESSRDASEEFLAAIRRELAGKLKEAGIPSRIEGRIKRPYSIHQKLQRQKVGFDMVYDLMALRVITDSKMHCYAAMGIIHGQWQPVPGRIKDFVAMPRPNLYQSLHTSVVTKDGRRFELQIRTEQMHEMAEEGICAHWKYKEGRRGPDVSDGQMAWVRRLVEWQREMKDSTDFLSTLKIELYTEEVYVFTPKGKVIALPSGATPVDFAYAVHTEVGHACRGAKVDGQIVPLKRPLETGQIVEVLTREGSHPSQDWLGFVATTRARNKIKQWLNSERRRQAVEIGDRLLEKEARAARVALKKLPAERMESVCREYGCATADDLRARLGYGRFSARQILRKLFPEMVAAGHEMSAATDRSRRRPASESALEVRGIDDILIYRAGCCNPIPGEPIAGYVTRGKGVSVHSIACRNVQNLMFESERRVDVRWAPRDSVTFPVRLTAFADDRPGLLKDLTSILANEGLNITKVESHGEGAQSKEGVGVDFVVEVQDKAQLERVSEALEGMDEVRRVERRSRL